MARSGQERRRWAVQAVGVGLFSLLASGVPFWTTGLQVMLKFPRDRFTMPFMLGVAILLVALLELPSTGKGPHGRLRARLPVCGPGLEPKCVVH